MNNQDLNMQNDIVDIYLDYQAEALKYGEYVILRPHNTGVEMIAVMLSDVKYLN